MKTSLLFLFLLLVLPVHAKDVAAPLRYFDPATVDFKALLPAPPTNDSPDTRKELDLILADQKTRTRADVARITREAKHLDAFLFDTVLGPRFTAQNLPLTAALFRNVAANAFPVVDASKKFWNRPRPFVLDSHIHPPIDLPKNGAYPSGHSTAGNLDALILAELTPNLKESILMRGKQIGDDRVLGGVHYPSDVAAGETLAKALFAKLMASPVFQADLAAAKAEVASIRPKT